MLAVFVVFAPGQANRIRDLRASMGTQSEILADLHDITGDFGCAPVTVPNHRPVPHVALWTGIPPGEIVSAQLAAADVGRLRRPRQRARAAQLHARPARSAQAHRDVPPGFERVAANRSWVLYARCQANANATG